jgi:hypothetical protein
LALQDKLSFAHPFGYDDFMTSEKIAREYRAQVAAIPETDIAWFGGWLCADGSIKRSQGRAGGLCLAFALTDREPLDRFAEMFGNSVCGPLAPSGLGRKPRYEWRISGTRAVIVVDRVRPWLSPRYLAKADDLLASWQPRGHCGVRLVPDDVIAIRRELAAGGHGVGRRLARQYGVSDAMISAIKTGRMWPGVGQ